MLNTSYNVIFVYSLLVLDLLINITDNLLPLNYQAVDKGTVAFTIVIIQIVAIVCVVVDLLLHFFETSDKVRQVAWLRERQQQEDTNDHKKKATAADEFQFIPMPSRVALKLVLDKYWWSLLVGSSYLVLTIILQIVRLDPSWHTQHNTAAGGIYNRANFDDHTLSVSSLFLGRSSIEAELQPTNGNEPPSPLLLNSSLPTENSNELHLSTSAPSNKPRDYVSLVWPSTLLPTATKQQTSASEFATTGNRRMAVTTARRIRSTSSFLPIFVLLLHKLMSTCYYVSFVVVYRASPSQMLNRILFTTGNGAGHKLQHERRVVNGGNSLSAMAIATTATTTAAATTTDSTTTRTAPPLIAANEQVKHKGDADE